MGRAACDRKSGLDRSDYSLLLASRVVRAFAFGFMSVLLAVHLRSKGLNVETIGIILALGVLTASVYSMPFAALAGRIGRRKALALVGVLMALTGFDLAFASDPIMLAFAGLTGMIGAATVDLGPFLALEQAILTEAVAPSQRNVAFGRYSLSGGLALAAGSLAAAAGGTAQARTLLFIGYGVIGLLTGALAIALSPRVEVVRDTRASSLAVRMRPLVGLSALFALDAIAGGLVIQTVVAYWLYVRFHAGIEVLGSTLGAVALVQALSYEVAGRLADRIGLIRTMVFTHIPSQVLTLFVPFSPNLWIAVALLIARACLSEMDVPARQSYVASIVPPAEREGALAITGTVRGVAYAAGPALAGVAMQVAPVGVPFLAAGFTKIVYDVVLYLGWRRRPGEHERAHLARQADRDPTLANTIGPMG